MAFDFEFTPKVDQPVNSLITSNVRTMSGITGSILVSVTGPESQLIIDGVPKSGTQPISTGQTLQLGLRSSSIAGNVVHAIVDFGGMYDAAFSVVTAATARDKVLEGSEGKATIEFPAPYPGGTALEQNNRIFSITNAGSVVNKLLAPVSVPSPAVLGDANDYLFVADYHNNLVHRLNDSMEVVHSIPVTKPFNISFSPTAIVGGGLVDILVTDTVNDKVRVLRREFDYSLSQTVNVGESPMGIVGASSAADKDLISFYVACRDAGTVEKWARPASGGQYTKVETFACGAGSTPTNLYRADNASVYVTLPGIGSIAKLIDGAAPIIKSVGDYPTHIVGDATHLYITLQDSDGLLPIQMSNMTEGTLVQTQAIVGPMALALSNDIITVCGIDSGTVERYSTGMTPVYIDTVNVGKHVIAATAYKNETRVLCMYENAAKRTGQVGVIPTGFGPGYFSEPVGIPDGSQVDSNPVTISGLDSSTLITVPSIWDVTIIVNGVSQGREAVVQNDDVMILRVTMSSNDGDIIHIPVTTVGNGFNWSITGVAPDPTPITGYISGG
jgi:hypothetical protein